jgi:proline dehydrogenase
MTQLLHKPWVPARRLAAACLAPILRQAARAYVAGEALDDALRVRRAIASRGISCTIGFFNGDEQTPAEVVEQYLLSIFKLRRSDDYISIKLPALGYAPSLLGRVSRWASGAHLRLHLDSLWPESADPTFSSVEELQLCGGADPIGITLPARWRRSVTDAAWAVERRLCVRIVKGQWPDPHDPGRDLQAGFLEVVDALAGRARHVAVASHDVPLAQEALRRLRAGGTPCELELLYGLPSRESLAMARRMGVKTRFYIPYGKAHLPYAVARAMDNPYLIKWLLKDLCASALRRG